VKRFALAAALLLAAACGENAVRAPESSKPIDWSGLEAGWTELPAPPYDAACAASVWTGSELLYWGGDDSCHEGPVRNEGAAFDPATRTWRALPPSPLDGRSSATAVWSGEELIVWGGWNGGEREDGAAYRPSTDEWRMLAESPLSPQVPTAAVWTGREMFVWGDVSRPAGSADGAAYDPAADAWRLLPPAPYALNQAQAVWTGGEMIVFGSLLDGNNHSERPTASGLAFDPERNQWREIATYPLSPQASMVVWTGREMIAWDYELRAGAYDPRSDTWRSLPDLPLEFYECYPDGALAGDDFVLAWHCGQAAILDLATNTWRELPRPPRSIAGHAIAASGIVLFAGAWPPGSRNPLWAYRPGPLGATAFVPETERRGERDLLPLTFPDGTRVVLSYPLELALAGLSVQPDVSYFYRDDRPARFALTLVYGPASPQVDQVALPAGSWTIIAPLRDAAEREVVERSLRAHETPDGFPVIEAEPPLALSHEFGEGGGVMLALGDLRPEPDIASSLDPLIELAPADCHPEHVEIGGSYGATCLGGVYVGVYGDRPLIEAVLAGVRLEEQ
jgi:hypothetical protein